MTRKSDVNLVLLPPLDMSEVVDFSRQVTPSSDGLTGDKVVLVPVGSSVVAKQQLDPRQITVTYLIENGVQINPGQLQDIFKISDPADVQRLSENVSMKVFKYLVDNEPSYNYEKNRFESVESEKS